MTLLTPLVVFLVCTGTVIALLLGSTCFFEAPPMRSMKRYVPPRNNHIQMHVIGEESSEEEV